MTEKNDFGCAPPNTPYGHRSLLIVFNLTKTTKYITTGFVVIATTNIGDVVVTPVIAHIIIVGIAVIIATIGITAVITTTADITVIVIILMFVTPAVIITLSMSTSDVGVVLPNI